jgi:microcystin-dependent protein
MSNLTVKGNASGTGTVILEAPNTNSNRTITLPDESITLVGNSSFAGMVAFFAMNTAPSGWLDADGSAVSRTTYAALFAAIGTTFGSGDGSTTFNLPDMRGEFPRGWDDGRGVDSGRAFGSAQLDQMQKITGGVTGEAFTVNSGASSSASGAMSIGASAGATVSKTTVAGRGWNGLGFDSANSPNARVSSTTSGETRARNVALLACIKF